LILCGGEVVGYVSCCALNGKLCRPGGGLCIQLYCDNEKTQGKLYKEIINYIHTLAKENSCEEIVIMDTFNDGQLSCLGEVLFNNRYKSNLTFEMIVEYSGFNEENYHRDLRKSYKSLLNWGKKNLSICYLVNQNISRDLFDSFKELHQKISGRQTRSDETWMIQYQMIQDNMGELILGYYEGKLVAGSLFLDQGDVSIYSTGVYERELFDFGISHSLLYQGICRSYNRGNTSKFLLGYFDTDIQDSKWYNIQFFKKGFSEKLVPTILWNK
jgi:hypothetical protein